MVTRWKNTTEQTSHQAESYYQTNMDFRNRRYADTFSMRWAGEDSIQRVDDLHLQKYNAGSDVRNSLIVSDVSREQQSGKIYHPVQKYLLVRTV